MGLSPRPTRPSVPVASGAGGCNGANSTERRCGSTLRPMVATDVATDGARDDSADTYESLQTEYWYCPPRSSDRDDARCRNRGRAPRDCERDSEGEGMDDRTTVCCDTTVLGVVAPLYNWRGVEESPPGGLSSLSICNPPLCTPPVTPHWRPDSIGSGELDRMERDNAGSGVPVACAGPDRRSAAALDNASSDVPGNAPLVPAGLPSPARAVLGAPSGDRGPRTGEKRAGLWPAAGTARGVCLLDAFSHDRCDVAPWGGVRDMKLSPRLANDMRDADTSCVTPLISDSGRGRPCPGGARPCLPGGVGTDASGDVVPWPRTLLDAHAKRRAHVDETGQGGAMGVTVTKGGGGLRRAWRSCRQRVVARPTHRKKGNRDVHSWYRGRVWANCGRLCVSKLWRRSSEYRLRTGLRATHIVTQRTQRASHNTGTEAQRRTHRARAQAQAHAHPHRAHKPCNAQHSTAEGRWEGRGAGSHLGDGLRAAYSGPPSAYSFSSILSSMSATSFVACLSYWSSVPSRYGPSS